MTDAQQRAAPGHAAACGRLAGLLGWVRLFGSAAIPALAGLALLGRWSWWDAGCAGFAAATGKWLAHAFEHHRQRLAFEAETMVRGMAPAEFWTEWVEAFTGRG